MQTLSCGPRSTAVGLAALSLIAFVTVLHRMRTNTSSAQLLVTVVDYRWNSLANLSVRLETTYQHWHELYTNERGQVEFNLTSAVWDGRYVQISAGGASELILPTDGEIVFRVDTINHNTGEEYDDEFSN